MLILRRNLKIFSMCSPLFDFSCLVALVVLMPREVTSLLNDTWFLSLLRHLQGVWAHNGMNWKKWGSTFQQNMSCCARSLFAARSISLINTVWMIVLGTKGMKANPTKHTAAAENSASPRCQGVSWIRQQTRGCFKKGIFKCSFGQLHGQTVPSCPSGESSQSSQLQC